MVYVSSACFESNTIKGSVENLAMHGFNNIELTGGTKFYNEIEYDILELQEKYNLNLLLHNYFPPPKTPFMLNLASLDDDIYKKSIGLCTDEIRLSKKVGGKHYGVHAGFLIDFRPKQAGRKIDYQLLNHKQKAIKRFSDAWSILIDEANNYVSLYVENNPLSITNAKTFGDKIPFLLTDYKIYLELKEYVDFNLLLDVAHLKVSTNSLGLDFDKELEKLIQIANYVHLSDNDGLHDNNEPFNKNSSLLSRLRNCNLDGKIITLEIYDEIKHIKSSYSAITDIVKSEYS